MKKRGSIRFRATAGNASKKRKTTSKSNDNCSTNNVNTNKDNNSKAIPVNKTNENNGTITEKDKNNKAIPVNKTNKNNETASVSITGENETITETDKSCDKTASVSITNVNGAITKTDSTDHQLNKNVSTPANEMCTVKRLIDSKQDFMKVIEGMINEQFSDQIENVKSVVGNENHCLLVFMDPHIMRCVTTTISKHYEKIDRRVCFLNIDSAKDADIYCSLENDKTFTFLVSENAMVVERMERRIRSRFNHVKFFFGYLKGERRLVRDIRNEYLAQKYNLPVLTFQRYLEMFKPLHIALIMCWLKHPIDRKVLLKTMREYLYAVKEMRNVRDKDIIDAYYAVESTGIMKNGKFNGDQYVFTEFVKKQMPYYLRKLI